MATVIAWRDDYKIDLLEMDQQHEALVELINRFYTALVEKSAENVIDKVLAELVQYTIFHFSAEEELMRSLHYRDYEEHKATHDRIADRIRQFEAQYRQGGRHIGMELLFFLKDWLTTHINEEDRAYASRIHASKKGWLSVFS